MEWMYSEEKEYKEVRMARKYTIFKVETFTGIGETAISMAKEQANTWMKENDVRIKSQSTASAFFHGDHHFTITILYVK